MKNCFENIRKARKMKGKRSTNAKKHSLSPFFTKNAGYASIQLLYVLRQLPSLSQLSTASFLHKINFSINIYTDDDNNYITNYVFVKG